MVRLVILQHILISLGLFILSYTTWPITVTRAGSLYDKVQIVSVTAEGLVSLRCNYMFIFKTEYGECSTTTDYSPGLCLNMSETHHVMKSFVKPMLPEIDYCDQGLVGWITLFWSVFWMGFQCINLTTAILKLVKQ